MTFIAGRVLRTAGAVATCAFILATPLRAQQAQRDAVPIQTIEELKRRVEELERIVKEQQDAIKALMNRTGAQPPETAAAGTPPQPVPPPPGATASPTSTYFNPSVSVIGNFLAAGGHNAVENLPAADLSEAEVALQAIVDPYARGDFYFSFAQEGVSIEEGFATFTALPWDLLVKVGRTRTVFGKVNTLHLHNLPWADEPLPVVNLLGGEEGWAGTGVSIAKLLPLPGDTFSELTLQVMDGDVDNLFAAPERSDLAYNAHYRVFRDLTEATNLDFGLSYGFGSNGSSSSADTTLTGIDTTLRWKPLRTATYRSATFRGEYFWSDREDPAGDQGARGWFASGEYQFAKRWAAGARLEAADHADDANLTDRGGAVLVTFRPSEFLLLRGEYRRRDYAFADTANEFLMQLQFAIGAHGAHPF